MWGIGFAPANRPAVRWPSNCANHQWTDSDPSAPGVSRAIAERGNAPISIFDRANGTPFIADGDALFAVLSLPFHGPKRAPHRESCRRCDTTPALLRERSLEGL